MKKTILLIEDDHDIRVAFRMALENCGFSVISVTTGWDALSLLKKINPPHLIILDLAMPIMSGEEFLNYKNRHTTLADIPVLIVSCHQDRMELLRGYSTLKKPVDLETLSRKVFNCLEAEL